jgi:hypothetical protein
MALPRAAVLNIALIGAFALAAFWAVGPAVGPAARRPPTSARRYPNGPFEPAAYGLPDRLAGYPVLAVLTAANTACMGPNEKRLVLLSDQPDINGIVTNRRVADVMSEAARLGLSEYTQGGIEWVGGPGATRESIIANTRQWNAAVAAGGCIRTGGPVISADQLTPPAS